MGVWRITEGGACPYIAAILWQEEKFKKRRNMRKFKLVNTTIVGIIIRLNNVKHQRNLMMIKVKVN